jgi:hypothetical protein
MARVEPPTPPVMRPRLNASPPRPAGLEAACAEPGRFSGEIVRHALRRQLQLMRFERLRRQALHYGKAAGWLKDDDVFSAVSCALCSVSTSWPAQTPQQGA